MGKLSAYASLFLVAACGGQSQNNDPGPRESDGNAHTACADLATAMCARREECASPTDRNARYATEADCRERTALACSEWAALPDTQVTPTTIADCVAATTTGSCPQINAYFYSNYGDLPNCFPNGTRRDSEPCASNAQCASGHCTTSTTCGTCQTVTADTYRYGYEGHPCKEEEFTYCQGYLSCEALECTRPACDEPGCLDHGHHCSDIGFEDTDCPLGTHCMNQNDRGRGQCQPYAPDGASCNWYNGPPCLYPAKCIDERCQLPHELDCR